MDHLLAQGLEVINDVLVSEKSQRDKFEGMKEDLDRSYLPDMWPSGYSVYYYL